MIPFRIRSLFFLMFAFGAVGLQACDDGPSGSGAGVAPPGGTLPGSTGPSSVATFEQFGDQAAARYCPLLAPCCPREGRTANPACGTDLKASLGKLAAQGGTYSPEGGAACLDGLAQVTCDVEPSTDSCGGIFRTPAYRTKAPLAPCTLSSDCIAPAGGSVSCDKGQKGAPACRVYVQGKQGDACSSGGDDTGTTLACERALVCDFQTNKCARIPALGEPCLSGLCGEKAVCRDGTCAQQAADGSACGSSGDCLSFRCDNKVCVGRGGPGAPCKDATDCASYECAQSTQACVGAGGPEGNQDGGDYGPACK